MRPWGTKKLVIEAMIKSRDRETHIYIEDKVKGILRRTIKKKPESM
jgi:hypothetical protein